MAKTPPKIEKKEVSVVTKTTSGPVKFHSLDENEKRAVILRMATGEVHLQGPDSLVIEVKP
jgi:hypothetical protein